MSFKPINLEGVVTRHTVVNRGGQSETSLTEYAIKLRKYLLRGQKLCEAHVVRKAYLTALVETWQDSGAAASAWSIQFDDSTPISFYRPEYGSIVNGIQVGFRGEQRSESGDVEPIIEDQMQRFFSSGRAVGGAVAEHFIKGGTAVYMVHPLLSRGNRAATAYAKNANLSIDHILPAIAQARLGAIENLRLAAKRYKTLPEFLDYLSSWT